EAEDFFELEVEDIAGIVKDLFFGKVIAQFNQNSPHAAEDSGALKAQIFSIADAHAGVAENPVEDHAADGMAAHPLADAEFGDGAHGGGRVGIVLGVIGGGQVADGAEKQKRVIVERGTFQLQFFQTAVG